MRWWWKDEVYSPIPINEVSGSSKGETVYPFSGTLKWFKQESSSKQMRRAGSRDATYWMRVCGACAMRTFYYFIWVRLASGRDCVFVFNFDCFRWWATGQLIFIYIQTPDCIFTIAITGIRNIVYTVCFECSSLLCIYRWNIERNLFGQYDSIAYFTCRFVSLSKNNRGVRQIFASLLRWATNFIDTLHRRFQDIFSSRGRWTRWTIRSLNPRTSTF